eukprot:m51a1_g11994 putative domain containing protein (897) ;mRNA; f:910533-913702
MCGRHTAAPPSSKKSSSTASDSNGLAAAAPAVASPVAQTPPKRTLTPPSRPPPAPPALPALNCQSAAEAPPAPGEQPQAAPGGPQAERRDATPARRPLPQPVPRQAPPLPSLPTPIATVPEKTAADVAAQTQADAQQCAAITEQPAAAPQLPPAKQQQEQQEHQEHQERQEEDKGPAKPPQQQSGGPEGLSPRKAADAGAASSAAAEGPRVPALGLRSVRASMPPLPKHAPPPPPKMPAPPAPRRRNLFAEAEAPGGHRARESLMPPPPYTERAPQGAPARTVSMATFRASRASVAVAPKSAVGGHRAARPLPARPDSVCFTPGRPHTTRPRRTDDDESPGSADGNHHQRSLSSSPPSSSSSSSAAEASEAREREGMGSHRALKETTGALLGAEGVSPRKSSAGAEWASAASRNDGVKSVTPERPSREVPLLGGAREKRPEAKAPVPRLQPRDRKASLHAVSEATTTAAAAQVQTGSPDGREAAMEEHRKWYNRMRAVRDRSNTVAEKSDSAPEQKHKHKGSKPDDDEIIMVSEPQTHSPFYRAGSQTGAPQTKEEEMATQQFNVMNEIYFTEYTYVQDLDTIIEIALRPLSRSSIISERELFSVFSNLEELPPVNRRILEQLATVCEGLTRETFKKCPPIGQIFLDNVKDLCSTYQIYCSNQGTCERMLDQLERTNVPFRAFQEAAKENPASKKLKFNGWLIKPIQRICKYPLLLRELHKVLPESDPEKAPLSQAIDEIKVMLERINEHISALQQIETLKNKICGGLAYDDIDELFQTQQVIKEGTLVVHQDKKKEPKEMNAVLLSNTLLLTHYKGSFSKGVTAVLIRLDAALVSEPKKQDYILLVDVSKQEKYMLSVPPSSSNAYLDRLLWYQEMNDIINRNLESKLSASKKAK